MVKVVTIDFDIIMSPCIEFYNDLIGVEDPLKDFVKDFSFLTNLPADLYQYEHLTRYIIRSLKNVCQIHFITKAANRRKAASSLFVVTILRNRLLFGK